MDEMTPGSYLKTLREDAGLTTRQLAERAGYSDGARSTISQIENGSNNRKNVGRQTIQKLMRGLNLEGTPEHQEMLRLAGQLRPGEDVTDGTTTVVQGTIEMPDGTRYRITVRKLP